MKMQNEHVLLYKDHYTMVFKNLFSLSLAVSFGLLLPIDEDEFGKLFKRVAKPAWQFGHGRHVFPCLTGENNRPCRVLFFFTQ